MTAFEQRKLLQVAFWIIAVVSVVAGLYLAAIDRLLIASAVVLSACLPLTVLSVVRTSQARVGLTALTTQQRRNGFAIMVTGVVTMAVGALLTMVWPGTLANVLLVWASPGMIMGGATVYWYARNQQTKGSNQKT